MPQEELGYIELEWTCKNCGTRNPGTRKNCVSCGAAMNAQNQFELPVHQELIKDETKIASAAVGPDVACPYCGTRNAGSAAVCKQCGGDLKGAQARTQGGVLGAFDDSQQAQVKCATCGSMNPANAFKCASCGATLKRPAPQPAPAVVQSARGFNPLLIAGIVALLLLCAIGGYFMFFRTSAETGKVQSVNWQRTIAVLALMPMRDATWRDQIPGDSKIVSCEAKPRRYSDSPEPDSEKVCGTPYVLDQGNGTGKVVQDCQFLVKDQYCTFTRLQWTVTDTVAARGHDLNPYWPALSLQNQQREGNRAEEYRVIFDAGGNRYTFTPANANEFAKYKIGSQWKFKVNALGSIMELQPAQ